MLYESIHFDIRSDFIRLNRDLKSFRPWRRYGKQKDYLSNNTLLSSASRITVPGKFEPYIKIIEKRTGTKIPSNSAFSLDEVKEADRIALNFYSKENFDYSKFNLDELVKASWKATTDLGINNIGLTELNTLDSALSFPGNSSSCYPIYGPKRNPKAIKFAVNHANKFLADDIPRKRLLFSQITTLFHRYQYKIDSDGELVKKARPIWGIPFSISVIEGFFFRNLINEIPIFLKANGFITTSLGRDLIDISENIIAYHRSSKAQLVSLDLKNFDSRVPSFMWALFYANMLRCFNIDRRYLPHFEALMLYHCYTPYLYMGTRLNFQRQGTPSGCLITALFNTWVNRTIINLAHAELGYEYPFNRLCVLGDDNLFPLLGFSAENIFNVFYRFGMEVNKLKTEIVNSVKDVIPFLGYLWDLNNRAYQSRSWYITHLCFPSSFYTNQDISISLLMTFRAISICMPLYNGYSVFMKLIGNDDKVFRELYEKYKLGVDTTVKFITSQRKYEEVSFPLSLFINGIWEQKAKVVTGDVT